MPDSDLVSGATVAGELSSASTNPAPTDERLLRLIQGVSDAVLRYLSRSAVHFDPAITEKVRGFGRPKLLVERSPITSITSITLPDGTVCDPSEYESLEDDAAIGAIYRHFSWPDTALIRGGIVQQDRDAGTERRSITVVYAGGWVTPGQAPQFNATTAYSVGDYVLPSRAKRTGLGYRCTASGAAGAEPSAWPKVIGGTVAAGGSTFTAVAPALPNDIEHAALLGVVGLWRGRGKYQNLSQETIGGDVKPWYDYALPFNARQLLDQFVRLR